MRREGQHAVGLDLYLIDRQVWADLIESCLQASLMLFARSLATAALDSAPAGSQQPAPEQVADVGFFDTAKAGTILVSVAVVRRLRPGRA